MALFSDTKMCFNKQKLEDYYHKEAAGSEKDALEEIAALIKEEGKCVNTSKTEKMGLLEFPCQL